MVVVCGDCLGRWCMRSVWLSPFTFVWCVTSFLFALGFLCLVLVVCVGGNASLQCVIFGVLSVLV